jgi:hypothetical protein
MAVQNRLVAVAGHPERKSWWRNFETERGFEDHIRRASLPLHRRVVRGADEPKVAADFVWCRPR